MSAVADSACWNPRLELTGRAELEALQLFKLKRMVNWAYEQSAFYREKYTAAGFHPDQIQSLTDIARIPMLTKSELLDNQQSKPHFGSYLTADQTAALRWHQTSGTSGRAKLQVLDGIKDWSWGAELWALGLYGAGLRRSDITYLAFAYGSFIGFWGAHYGAEKIGSTVIASGGQSSDERVRHLADIGATAVCVTPTYALRLSEAARTAGIDLAKSPVRMVVLSGEPGGSLPATRRAIEEAWGAEVFDTAGMSEVGSIVMFECARHPQGMHIIEDHLIEEVLALETGGRAAYGQEGERIVTSFGRGIMPLIRYKTGDLVCKVPAAECACGRVYDIYRGGILGRVDDMKLIRGINVYPSSVEAIVREFTEIDEFQIVITKERDIYDEITVRCELRQGQANVWDDLGPRLSHALAEGHGGLRFNVDLAASGELPRFDLKARRLVDKRGGR